MNIADITPLNNRILLEVVNEEVQYSGAIHLAPQVTKEPSSVGIVSKLPVDYIGPLVEGMKVQFPQYSGSAHINDPLGARTEYRLIKADELLGYYIDGEGF